MRASVIRHNSNKRSILAALLTPDCVCCLNLISAFKWEWVSVVIFADKLFLFRLHRGNLKSNYSDHINIHTYKQRAKFAWSSLKSTFPSTFLRTFGRWICVLVNIFANIYWYKSSMMELRYDTTNTTFMRNHPDAPRTSFQQARLTPQYKNVISL